jgi:hypothetical protein
MSGNFWKGLQGLGEGLAGRGPQWQAAQARMQEAETLKAAQEERARQAKVSNVKDESQQLAAYTFGKLRRMVGAEYDETDFQDTLKMHLRGMAGMGANRQALNDLGRVLMSPGKRENMLMQYMQDIEPMFGGESRHETLTGAQLQDMYGVPADPNGLFQVSPDGKIAFVDGTAGMTPYQEQSTILRREDLLLERKKAERDARKLSPQLEGYQLEQDASYQTALSAASSSDQLAQQYQNYVNSGGAIASLGEFAKGVFGAQDAETKIRTDYARLRNSLVMGDLPPGVASDKDIEIAMSGYPKPTDSPEYVASFLRGMAKMNRVKAAQALFNKNYLSANRSIDKKDRYWMAPIEYTVNRGGKEVTAKTSLAEIYYSALEANISVEELLRRIGVKDKRILSKVGY